MESSYIKQTTPHLKYFLEFQVYVFMLFTCRHYKLQKKIEVYRLYEQFLLQSIERLPESKSFISNA